MIGQMECVIRCDDYPPLAASCANDYLLAFFYDLDFEGHRSSFFRQQSSYQPATAHDRTGGSPFCRQIKKQFLELPTHSSSQ